MKLTFFGHSAWGLEVAGKRILIDPFPTSDDSRTAMRSYAADDCDLVLVTHGGYDHIGISVDLAKEATGPKLVSEMAVIEYAQLSGLAPERCESIGWNGAYRFGDWHVQALEARHWSNPRLADGRVLRGIPLSLIVWHKEELDLRVFHSGDTALFSDLSLYGQFHAPTLALIGVAGATPGRPGAMSAPEAAQACLWLGVDVALPMHFPLADRQVAEAFCSAVQSLPRRIRTWVPEIGESFRVTHEIGIFKESTQEPLR